jgi:hypothetical protein
MGGLTGTDVRNRINRRTILPALVWVHGVRKIHGLQEKRGVWTAIMKKSFKVGDRVSWNSEAGRVSGTITHVHTRDFDLRGYTRHARANSPQYEIKSARTDHTAFHKGSALTKLRD